MTFKPASRHIRLWIKPMFWILGIVSHARYVCLRVKYNAAPITSGMPRKTGIDWVSFLYGTEGPSRGSG